MRIALNIDKTAELIINILQDSGYKAYVVGGCVRDSLLKLYGQIDIAISDWDICTSAKVDEIKRIFKCTPEFKVISTGEKHGTLTLVKDGYGSFEVTTFRIDGEYSDNRRPDSVEFTLDVKHDLLRRDLTINAIAYNHSEGLVGAYNIQEHLSDIQNKRIKFVGNAIDRIEEDPLRILRAIRFASKLGFNIDEDDEEVMLNNKHLLNKLAKERVQSELLGIVNGVYADEDLLRYVDIIIYILPELKNSVGFKQYSPHHKYDVYEHTVMSINHIAHMDAPIIKMALLLHDIGKPSTFIASTDIENNLVGRFLGHAKESIRLADELLDRLTFSNKDKSKILNLIKYHDSNYIGKPAIRRAIRKIGMDDFEDLLIVRECDIYAQSDYKRDEKLDILYKTYKMFNEIKLEEPKTNINDLKVNGNDLIELGIKPGKIFGYILEDLMLKVIDEEINNEKQELLDYIKYKHLNIPEK